MIETIYIARHGQRISYWYLLQLIFIYPYRIQIELGRYELVSGVWTWDYNVHPTFTQRTGRVLPVFREILPWPPTER